MASISLKFKAEITDLILKAKKAGEFSEQESDYLVSMAMDSAAVNSTVAMLSKNKAPDFPYAALHFATGIWREGDVTEDDFIARAGYMLAQYVMTTVHLEKDAYWAQKLLRDFYNSHD